jgi:hypothetical protein
VRGGADGIAKLRLRPTKNEKRLIEELTPIAHYVQARCREGRRIKVRWFSGSQPYDATLWSSGAFVKLRMAPRKLSLRSQRPFIKTSTSRVGCSTSGGERIAEKGILRNKKTGDIVSRPHVHTPDELATDLAGQILERLKSKSDKNYSPGTVLVVNCVPNGLILDSEWNDAIE